MDTKTCPCCGDEYERLGQHWSMSSVCSHPSIPKSRIELLVGLLMGDGTIHNPPSAKNVRVEVTNINKTFLQWVSEELGWLSNGVSLKRTSEEIRDENRKSNYERFSSLDYEIRDQYGLTTVRHPELNRFANWYTSGQKRFSNRVHLSPRVLKIWYVCDGHLIWGDKGHIRPQVWISAENEADRPEYIKSLFSGTPINPKFNRGRVMLTSDESEWFFDYVGKPAPGFKYKFTTQSKGEYENSKEEFYRNCTTQTE